MIMNEMSVWPKIGPKPKSPSQKSASATCSSYDVYVPQKPDIQNKTHTDCQ